MNEILSKIGACSIVIVIFIAIKIINDNIILYSESKKTYKIDQDDDD